MNHNCELSIGPEITRLGDALERRFNLMVRNFCLRRMSRIDLRGDGPGPFMRSLSALRSHQWLNTGMLLAITGLLTILFLGNPIQPQSNQTGGDYIGSDPDHLS